MAKKIKKYKVGMDSETYAISMVEMPAIEEDFIALTKQEEEKVFLQSEEKHMVYGAVLVPDKDIYRNNGEKEFYITFTKDSIEKMSQEFMKEYRQKEVTLDHSDEANEVCVVESWLKSDMYKDKSVALGLNDQLPIGTWFCGMKVNSIDTWERIKAGELRGFSVESLISMEEFEKQDDNKDKNVINMDEMSFWSKMKEVLKEAFTIQDVEEVIEEKFEEEAPKVEEAPTEEPKVEEPKEEEPKFEEPKVDEKPKEEEKVEEPKPNPLDELVKNLTEEVKALKESNEALQDKIKKLGKQPSAAPVKTNAKPNPQDTYSNWREQMREMLG